MNRFLSCALLAGVFFLTSCRSHFISDDAYRAVVAGDLTARESVIKAAGIDLDSMGLSLDG